MRETSQQSLPSGALTCKYMRLRYDLIQMPPFRFGIVLLFVSSTGVSGDTLILKDGQKIEGHYLSSDAEHVRFEVDGKTFGYAVWLIRELRFSGTAPVHAEVRPAGLQGKEQQEAFCQVLTDFQQERRRLAGDPNPIRRAQMHPPDPWIFEPRLAAVFGSAGEFTDWTGRVFFTVSRSSVSIQFTPNCPAGAPTVTFTNGYPTDHRATAGQARITLSSPLAQQLGRGETGAEYRVSGHLFLRSAEPSGGIRGIVRNPTPVDPRQRFEGAQPGGFGNVANPQYLVQFSQFQSVSH